MNLRAVDQPPLPNWRRVLNVHDWKQRLLRMSSVPIYINLRVTGEQ